MTLFEFYSTPSALHRLNPMAKMVGMVIVMSGATLYFDPIIPGALTIGLMLALWLLGGAPLGLLLRWLLPALGMGLPLAIFGALYFDVTRVVQPAVIGRLGPWLLTIEGLWSALGLGLRLGCFMAASLFFVATTDPTDFALSLIQQAHLPYRFGYGLLVAYRFLPLLRTEFETIRVAHRVRGVGERAGLRGRFEQLRRYAIPLLAGAVRRSERTALAMDSKAFGAGPGRTYRRVLRVTRRDYAFVLGTLAYTVAVVVLASQIGVADMRLVPVA